jgi:hypothetical protein
VGEFAIKYAFILTALCEELCCSVKIVDPSNFDAEVDFGIVYGKGFTVNCFTAKYPGWLPSPKLNDVLILRSIKVSIIFHSCCLVPFGLVLHYLSSIFFTDGQATL